MGAVRIGFVLAVLLGASTAAAAPTLEEGAAAVSAGLADEAVARFEALANAGTVDANASFDRGLAYSLRLTREPKPGDFGQAIAAFEEAAALTTDVVLRERAEHAADAVRGELAKKRNREGAKEAFDPAPPLGETVVSLLPEGAWLALATLLAAAAAVGAQLRRERWAMRWLLQLGLLLAAPCLLAAWSAKQRTLLQGRAVVVAESARLLDQASRRPLVDHEPLVEGALLQVEPSAGSDIRVYAAGVHGVLPRTSLRLLAR